MRLEGAGDRLTDGAYLAVPCRSSGPTAGRSRVSRPRVARLAHGVFYRHIEDERLLRVRGFFDLYGAAVQLGLLPGRRTLGERALLLVRGFGLRARG